jgi:phospholipid/cholesterol/gamma-HCH transport system substrate-binding protein
MARRHTGEVLTGAVVLLVAAGFLIYAIAHTGRSAVSGYDLHATFDHIDGMGVGSDVRLAGVKVGSVIDAKIDPKSYLANVTLTVRNGIELPKDTSAEVTSEGLLGGKFLNLTPGGDPSMLQPGQTITITQSSVSLEQLLGKFIFSVTDMVNAVKNNTGKSDGPAGGKGEPVGGAKGGPEPAGAK